MLNTHTDVKYFQSDWLYFYPQLVSIKAGIYLKAMKCSERKVTLNGVLDAHTNTILNISATAGVI